MDFMDEGIRVGNAALDANPAFRKFCTWARSAEIGGDLVAGVSRGESASESARLALVGSFGG